MGPRYKYEGYYDPVLVFDNVRLMSRNEEAFSKLKTIDAIKWRPFTNDDHGSVKLGEEDKTIEAITSIHEGKVAGFVSAAPVNLIGKSQFQLFVKGPEAPYIVFVDFLNPEGTAYLRSMTEVRQEGWHEIQGDFMGLDLVTLEKDAPRPDLSNVFIKITFGWASGVFQVRDFQFE